MGGEAMRPTGATRIALHKSRAVRHSGVLGVGVVRRAINNGDVAASGAADRIGRGKSRHVESLKFNSSGKNTSRIGVATTFHGFKDSISHAQQR